VRVAGHDVGHDADAVRAAIGVTGQFSAVDDLLTGEENLILMADLHHLGRRDGRRRAAGLLERFDLTEAATRTAATYSGGMRRRLDLAMTLVGAPRVVFLDEPTAGLDSRSRRTMWEIVRELVAGGATIFAWILLMARYPHQAVDWLAQNARTWPTPSTSGSTAATTKRLTGTRPTHGLTSSRTPWCATSSGDTRDRSR
jgi:ABC-type branched-subunit amino acid transport system ATPase component